MSKIYEALLRAEIDRLTAEKNGHSASFPRPSSIVLTEEPEEALSRTESATNGRLKNPERRPAVHAAKPASASLMGSDPVTMHETKLAAAPLTGSADLATNEQGETPAVTLEQVSRVPWTPDLKRLPALQQRGGAVEQIRGLRSRMHEFRYLNSIKTLLISSGLPEEGKSFVTANLAISFANYKSSRVLLIDGDMRRGTLHKLLGTHNEPGLTEFLSGKAKVSDIVQQAKSTEAGARLPSGLSSLSFIPCGTDTENAADLSGNGRFEQLLAEVGPAFDWIVVDSSPVNLVADGANLARYCDGVVLVTRGAVTKFETAQRALNELKAAKVLGVVLNAVKDVPAVGGYYGYDS